MSESYVALPRDRVQEAMKFGGLGCSDPLARHHQYQITLCIFLATNR